MKIRLLGWLAGLSALAAAVSPGCSQPKPECTVGSATVHPFAARFILVDGEADTACGNLTVATIGMQMYNADAGGVPDRNQKLVALQTLKFGRWTRGGATVEENPDLKPYAVGTFTSIEPDDNNICTVPTLSPAEVVVLPGSGGEGGAGDGGAGGAGDGGAGDGGAGGAGDGGAGGAGDGGAGGAGDGGAGGAGDGGAGGAGDGGAGGAGDGGAGGGVEPLEPGSRKFEWSNLRVFVTAANLGNQFEADLAYSEAGCTARYKVLGLWPQVDCSGEDGPDNTICQDPHSGISPDLKVMCVPNPEADPDPELGDPLNVCVLDSDTIPAFK
ncbi:uncharacterized protein SOCE26_052470 [Sorangium cellulosum]|uniref:Secreted protein n=1 Tax=Sorangium cellulosum TaxID=56 RepID=A0A2L0EWW4_SORCE|nr:hypothetical protein [Sorangium cellulosum]AUX43792.1 uncharacterized protein SOCE26_052470 [Sorangium cellulosum]